jgi:flagellar M-ring protein FliF
LSSTNAFRQVGLLIGLAASIAIGAAVVLWLWIPGGDDNFGGQDYGRFSSSVNFMGPQNENARLLARSGYRDKNLNVISVDSGPESGRRPLSPSGTQLEYTQKLEASYTQRIERLLEPLLGAESVRAQVTADIDFTAREQTLETFNPDSRVLRNNEREEQIKDHENNEKSAVINPGVLNKIRREVNSYELDKTTSLTRSAIGRINKLNIAVIVDDKLSRGVKGNIIRTPRTEKELDKLTGLVKKVIGFNSRRGDVINVIGTRFKVRRPSNYQLQNYTLQNNAYSSPTWGQVWVKDLFNKTLGTILVLLLIFSVIRPAMKSLVSLPAYSTENGAHFGVNTGDIRINPDNGLPDENDPGDYEKNMARATRVVESDPKLVAQIMKNWVSADGT